jgi:hypothetical protein
MKIILKKLHKRDLTKKPLSEISRLLQKMGIKVVVRKLFYSIGVTLSNDFYTCFVNDDLKNINKNSQLK